MNTTTQPLRLAGDIDVLLSHMVLWGLAAICEDTGERVVRAGWSDDADPRPQLRMSGDGTDRVGEIVREHAARHAAEGSWLHQKISVAANGSGEVALGAPRTAPPANEEVWGRVDAAHRAMLDALPTRLDQRMQPGLGYRSWWATGPTGKIRADKGCNDWEMRTRNRGSDVVTHRLLPLAQEVSSWEPSRIMGGLLGETVDDRVGKNVADSRSGTGFALPGPVDNARAWCALWGLTLVPVLPQAITGGRSPATLSRGDVPGAARRHLVMFASPRLLSVARARTVLRSSHLPKAAVPEAEDAAGRAEAIAWCRAQGIEVVLRFPVNITGSKTFPERQALRGKAVPL
ncbi:hypothetical protein [Brachybacterium sp. Marseille-Q7125]|uniref:hypothetical protein n=1 Tax=Brachybacterium sp. Marseille-Q7125 TaxID=2932815 RepID=UPI001FF5F3EA|nr:hypothetical protein [Brachybacterium sp. Marseille-Q7125]